MAPRLPYPVLVTVSGSFRKCMPQVNEAVEKFTALGATILSPKEPHVTGWHGNFALLQSDPQKKEGIDNDDHMMTIQRRHMVAIERSDFLFIANDGYVGPSVGAEIGCAICFDIPICVTRMPVVGGDGGDGTEPFTFSYRMTHVASYEEAVERALKRRANGYHPEINHQNVEAHIERMRQQRERRVNIRSRKLRIN